MKTQVYERLLKPKEFLLLVDKDGTTYLHNQLIGIDKIVITIRRETPEDVKKSKIRSIKIKKSQDEFLKYLKSNKKASNVCSCHIEKAWCEKHMSGSKN